MFGRADTFRGARGCPNGTDLSPLSEADLGAIADQLNDGPRKTLNWDTPKQRLELLLRA
ncbi:hypothetical protein [Schaalia meyeri]|uniref:hypothetical protein n=1 Tax=Schaalia meyeri TaxID=52773 RepID=UPI000A3E8DE7